MSLLNVPYLAQAEPGACLQACAAMVLAYLGQPAYQGDIGRQIGARRFGTPASNIRRLAAWGLMVEYRSGSLEELSAAVSEGNPSIVFVRTSELPYWREDTPHAVVVIGLDEAHVYLLDPAYPEETPVEVTTGDFSLAWSHFEQAYALIQSS